MNKLLLVLGAGRLNIPALKEMSKVARIVAVDKCPHEHINSPELRIFQCDFSDNEKLLNFVINYDFDGVYAMNDHAILPAAIVAKKFNLGSTSFKTSEVLLDKSMMRSIWNENKLSQPKYKIVSNLNDAKIAAHEIGYPIIVKPSASGGAGRGVYKINSLEELNFYFPLVKAECKYLQTMLIEQFIEGVESSLEVVFIKKKASLLAISSKDKAPGHSQVATEIVYPAQLSQDCIKKIFHLAEQAGLSLGISDGIGHFEVISNSYGIPFLIEVGGRAGGGHTFHPIVSHVSGVNYPQLVAHIYTGNFVEAEKLLAKEIEGNVAIYSFPVTQNKGKIKKISFGILPNQICIAECWKKEGENVDGMNSSMDRLGCFVFLSGKNVTEAVEQSRAIISSFCLELE